MDNPSADTAPAIPPAIDNAINTFAHYCEQAEIVVHLTHEGFQNVRMMPGFWKAIYGEGDGSILTPERERQITEAQRKADLAAAEAEAGFPIVHAHNLIGLWGALECFIEDLFVASIEVEPSLLAADPFRKVRLPAALLVQPDPRAQAVAVLNEATRAVDADMGVGVGKFERLLKMVGLDGAVPDRIRDAVFEAQQIRNVWAHRGGTADARFVERCPALGYAPGDRVNMGAPQFLHLMHGIHMYGAVVIRRCAVKAGRVPGAPECIGYEGTLTAVTADDSGDGGDDARP